MNRAFEKSRPRPNLIRRTPHRHRGVTLVEILVAIMIMGVGLISVSTLFPLGVLNMRAAMNENRTRHNLTALAQAAREYRTRYGLGPSRFADLTPFLGGDRRFEDGKQDGYRYLLLEGTSIVAEPVAIGKTGVHSFRVTPDTPVVDCTPSDASLRAEEAQRRVQWTVFLRGAETMEKLLNLDPTGTAIRQARPFLTQSTTVAQGFRTLDVDHNGHVTPLELQNPASSQPLVKALFSDLCKDLEFGAGDEDVASLPGIDLAHLTGDPAFYFTYASLCTLTRHYVTSATIADALLRLLEAAWSAEIRGDLKVKAASLKAYADLVRAQTNVSLTADSARVLLTLAGTL